MTEHFISEIQKLKEELKSKEVSLKEAILMLNDLFDKYDPQQNHEDGEKLLFKKIIRFEKLNNLKKKTSSDGKTIKELKILLLLFDLGFSNVTQKDIKIVLNQK